MKILLASNYSPPHGGVATTVYYLAKYLALNNQEITMVSFEEGFSTLKNVVGAIHESPVHLKINKCQGFKLLNDIVPYPWEIIHLIKLVKEQEVIFIHVPYFVISNILAVLGKLLHKKVVCMNHGPIYINWRNRLHLPFINSLIDKWLFLNQENVDFVKQYVKKIKPYEIVKNGIELKRYVRAIYESPLRRITKFIFVGRLEKEKGLEEMLFVIKAFPKNEFTFVGDGSYRSKLAQYKNVRLLGYLNSNLTIQQLRQSDCLLFPSYSESFGLVILEAVACGLPVITTITNSNSLKLIKNNGYVVKIKDSLGLKTAVNKIITHPLKVKSEYLKQYDWNYIINDYLKILAK